MEDGDDPCLMKMKEYCQPTISFGWEDPGDHFLTMAQESITSIVSVRKVPISKVSGVTRATENAGVYSWLSAAA
jgi:hypothetical protein